MNDRPGGGDVVDRSAGARGGCCGGGSGLGAPLRKRSRAVCPDAGRGARGQVAIDAAAHVVRQAKRLPNDFRALTVGDRRRGDARVVAVRSEERAKLALTGRVARGLRKSGFAHLALAGVLEERRDAVHRRADAGRVLVRRRDKAV